MQDIERLKDEILRDYPRLTREDSFSFECHPGVPCFNDCCGDVNIFLTPYDIIRLKNHLGISSSEFLSEHTIAPFDKNLTYPVVLLKMNEDVRKSCPFVKPEGCSVYEDRPWSCRMYPLGMASPKEGEETSEEEFFFLMKEEVCKGFAERKGQTVTEWLTAQKIQDYNDVGALFKDIVLHPFFRKGNHLTPEKIEMFFMVCYNIDAFRDFVFKSSFLDRFDVDAETVEGIKADDVELLKFGYRWLRFSMFGEQAMTIKSGVLEARERELAAKRTGAP